ncbi:MAG: DegT/DnrJ/EryC1/StrS family aminotransferase [Nitrospirae bacterium]|nr:DegT/DnrJ/EryC1/StrS family aminotransferase [Nitrospirota bacterium]
MPPRRAFGEDELRAVEEVFRHYWAKGVDFGYQGDFETRYTQAFVQYLRVAGFADGVCTGTAALYVATAALQLPEGSHVIVSPITDPGTVNALIFNRLVPVVADSMPDTYNMGLEQFLERVTDRTRAVMVVHATGRPAPVDRIATAARERGIRVIEDVSQAHGALIGDGKVGTFGDIAAFSTVFTKGHATGGCGGVVFTKDRQLFDLARGYADRGKPFSSPEFRGLDPFQFRDPNTFLFPALNLNIDEISCAIGLSTLAKVDRVRERRLAFLRSLGAALRGRSRACRLMGVSENDAPFFQPIFVNPDEIGCTKRDFAVAVAAEGIPLNPHYQYVVCEWPWLKRHLADDYVTRNAIDCRDRSFNLALNENYGEREVDDIATAITKVEAWFSK